MAGSNPNRYCPNTLVIPAKAGIHIGRNTMPS